MLVQIRWNSRSKDEVNRAADAESRPEVIHFERLLQEVDRKRHKHAKSDHLLHDLQFGRVDSCQMSRAIRRHLETILKERDAPTDEDHDPERLCVQSLQMTVPGKSHEDVGD